MIRKLLPMLALAAFCGTANADGAVVEQDFYIDDASDLVALCSEPATSPYAVAAVHFCHGYLVGAFQFYRASIAALDADPFFCAPNPPPSRNAVVEGLVKWVNARPERGKIQAIDAMFQYLGETYPCPAK